MKNFLLNNKYKIIGLFQLILIIIALINCFTKLDKHFINYTDMNYNAGKIIEGVGIHAFPDASFNGYFTYGPTFNLKSGNYKVSIEYSSTSNTNSFEFAGTNYDYSSCLYDDFNLPAGDNVHEFEVYIKKDIIGFGVTTIYDGDSDFVVKSITVEELFGSRTRKFVILILVLFIIDFIIFIVNRVLNNKIDNNKVIVFSALLALIIISSYPLFSQFLPAGDDIGFHLLRIEGIKDGILSGQFPVRIHPTQYKEFGYASSIFYGELFLYIPALLRILGFNLQEAYKILIVLINASTAILSYITFKYMINDKRIALIGTFAYVMAPYRITNIFTRAAVGEVTAMIFWPLIALALFKLCFDDIDNKKYKNNWLILSVGFTGLIQSHLLSCELAVAICVILSIFACKKVFRKNTLIELIKFVVATILINLSFLVPFLTFFIKGGITVVDKGSLQTNMIQQNGIYLSQLFNLFVNGNGMAYGHTAYKEYGMNNEMGTTVGLGLLCCIAVFLVLIILQYDKYKKYKYFYLTVLMTLAGALSVYMSTGIFPWDKLCRRFGSIVYNLQFPWRMMSVACIFLSILLILIIDFKKNDLAFVKYFGIFVIITTTISSFSIMYDKLNEGDIIYTYDGTVFYNNGSCSMNEYLPTGFDVDKIFDEDYLSNNDIIIDSFDKKYNNISFNVIKNSSDCKLTLPLIYYDGYKASDNDGNTIDVYPTEDNFVGIDIAKNYVGKINICYKGTIIWRICDIISLLTLIIFLVFGIKIYYNKI